MIKSAIVGLGWWGQHIANVFTGARCEASVC